MNNVVNGNEISKQIEEEIKQSIKGCIIRPSVAIIEIGDSEINNIFVKKKEEACNRVGIYFRHFKYDLTTPELTIINKIKELNNDDYVNGILLQLPISEKYNEKRLLNTISNSKDIDGLTDINIGRHISGRKTLLPCCALAAMTVLKENNVILEGKHAVVIGKGKLSGRPISQMLLQEGATVTICHSKTVNLKKFTLDADIIVSATGVKKLITEDMVKDGVVIIDIGNAVENGKVYGDVDFDKASKHASLITPPTGGIGPITVAMFLKNVMLCYNNKK